MALTCCSHNQFPCILISGCNRLTLLMVLLISRSSVAQNPCHFYNQAHLLQVMVLYGCVGHQSLPLQRMELLTFLSLSLPFLHFYLLLLSFSCTYITKYGSILYIGMDVVLAHYACTFKNSNFALSLPVIIRF